MYQVAKSLRKYGKSEVHNFILVDSETEKFSDAVKLSQMMATTHTTLLMIPDPRPASEGEYWFFTKQDTYVTYFVREVKSDGATSV